MAFWDNWGKKKTQPEEDMFTPPFSNMDTEGTRLFKQIMGSMPQPPEPTQDPRIGEMQGQIDDTTQRLNTSKYAHGEAKRLNDGRNWLQKSLNLDGNQSWFGQGLDLLGRIDNTVIGLVEGLTAKDAGLSQHKLDNMTDEQVIDHANNMEMLENEGLLGRLKLSGKYGLENVQGKRNSTGGQIIRNLAGKGITEDGTLGADDFIGMGLDIAMPGLGELKVFKSGKLLDKIDEVEEMSTALTTANDSFNKALSAVESGKDRMGVISQAYQSARDIAGKTTEYTAELSNLYRATKGTGTLEQAQQFSSELSDLVGKLSQKSDEFGSIFEKSRLLNNPEGLIEGLKNRRLTHLDPFSKGLEQGIKGADKVVVQPILNAFKGKVSSEAVERVLMEAQTAGQNGSPLAGEALEGFVAERLAKEEAGTIKTFLNKFNKTLKEPLRAMDSSDMITEGMKREMNINYQKYLEEVKEVFDSGAIPGFESIDELGDAIISTYELMNKETEMMDIGSLVKHFSENKYSTMNATKEAISDMTRLDAFVNAMGGEAGLPDGKLFSISDIDGDSFIDINKEMFKPHFKPEWERLVELYNEGPIEVDVLHGNKVIKEVINPDHGKGMIRFGDVITPEIEQLNTMYNQVPDFKRLVDDLNDTVYGIQETGGRWLTGNRNTYTDITDSGYFPHMRNDEVANFMSHADMRGTGFEKFIDSKEAGYLDSTDEFYSANIANSKSRAYKGTIKEANKVIKRDWDKVIGSPEALESVFNGNEKLWKEANELFAGKDYFQSELNAGFQNMVDGTFGSREAEIAKTSDMVVKAIFGETPGKVKADHKSLIQILPKNSLKAGKDKVDLSKENLKKLVDILEARTMQVGPMEQTDRLIDRFSKALTNDDIVRVEHDLAVRMNNIAGVGKSDDTVLRQSWDAINNTFKKLKVSNPNFNINNVEGHLSNTYLSGMPADEVIKAPFKGHAYQKSLKAPIEKAIAEGFNSLDDMEMEKALEFMAMTKKGLLNDNYSKAMFDMVDRYGDVAEEFGGLGKMAGQALNVEKGNPIKKVSDLYNKWVDLNMLGNEISDSSFRLGTYLYAKENPAYFLRMGLDTPEQMAMLTNFDPRNLSMLENDTLRKIIPFYTFARQNLEFQARNILVNPNKYIRAQRTANKLWDGAIGDKSKLRDFEKDNGYLPSIKNLFRTDEEKERGDYTSYKASLPFTDFGEIITDPVNYLMGASAPQIKGIYERATNTNVFTGQPIEKFKGEKDARYPWSKKTGHLLGMTGFDVPAKQFMDVSSLGVELAQGNFDEALQDLIILFNKHREGNTDKNAVSEQYDTLNALKELIQRGQAEGVTIPTKAELKKLGLWEMSQHDKDKEMDKFFKKLNKYKK